MPGRQPAGLLLSPEGASPSRWRVLVSPHPCPAVPGPRSSLRGRQRAVRTAQGGGRLRQRRALHSRGRPGGNTPAHAGTQPAGRCLPCAAWKLSPAAGGWSRRAPWQQRCRSQVSLVPVARVGPGGLTPKSCSQAAAAGPSPPAPREKGASSAHPERGAPRHGRSRVRPELSPARAPGGQALETSPRGTTGSRESHFTLYVGCRDSGLSRVGTFGMEKPGSCSDYSARKSPAFNAGFHTTHAGAMALFVFQWESDGVGVSRVRAPPPHLIFLSKINSQPLHGRVSPGTKPLGRWLWLGQGGGGLSSPPRPSQGGNWQPAAPVRALLALLLPSPRARPRPWP